MFSFLDELKKKLQAGAEKTVNVVNPFDGGKGFETNRDFQRRTQGRRQAPNVIERTIADVPRSAGQIASGFADAGQGLVRGAMGGVLKTPGTIGEFVGSGIKTLAPDNTPIDTMGESLRTGSQGVNQYIDKTLDKNFLLNKENASNKTAWDVSSSVGDFVSTLPLAAAKIPKVTKGLTHAQKVTQSIQKTSALPATYYGMRESNDQFDRAKEAGVSDSQAFATGLLSGGAQAAIEKFGIEKVFNPYARGIIGRTVSRMASEGATEGAQQLSSNAFTKTYDPTQSLTENVGESMVLGSLAGGAISAPVDIVQRETTAQKLSQATGVDMQTARRYADDAIQKRASQSKQELKQDISTLTDPSTAINNRLQEIRETNAADASRDMPVQNMSVADFESLEDTDPVRVAEYKQMILNGQPIDPVIIVRDSTGQMQIEDGKHRHKAHLELGLTEIPAKVTTLEALRDVRNRGSISLGGDEQTSIPEAQSPSTLSENTAISNLDAVSAKYGLQNDQATSSLQSTIAPQPDIDLVTEQVASYSNPDQFINDLADSMYSYDKTAKGGDMIRTESADGYGQDNFRRITDHTGFYSQHFKDNRSRPSKQAYRDEVIRQLRAGRGEFIGTNEKAIFDGLADREASLQNAAYEPTEVERLQDEIIRLRQQPESKGFILKETKPRNGRKDVIRIKKGSDGRMVKTMETVSTKVDTPPDFLAVDQSVVDERNKSQNNDLKKKLKRFEKESKETGTKVTADSTLSDVERIVYGKEPTVIDKEASVIRKGIQAGSIDENVGKGLRAVEQKMNDRISEMQKGNKFARGIARSIRAFNGEAGKTAEQMAKEQSYNGMREYSDQIAQDTSKMVKELVGTDPTRLAHLHALLDPETARSEGIDLDSIQLNDKEQKALENLKVINDYINDENYRMGFVSKKAWERNKGGKYIARIYDLDPEEAAKLEGPDYDTLSLGMYKSRNDWEALHPEVQNSLKRDPAFLVSMRLNQTIKNKALDEYGKHLLTIGDASQFTFKGSVRAPFDPRLGVLSGKYVKKSALETVEGYIFENKAMEGISVATKWYGELGLRRFIKKTKTVYNPVVRLGNWTSNYVFAHLNGINPVTFAKNWHGPNGSAAMIKRRDPLYLKAMKDGLLGNDILTKDFDQDVNTVMKQFANDAATLKGIKNLKAKIENRYGATDDKAKLAALKTHMDRGLPYKEALKRTRRGFQDYNRVGFLYELAANTPVFGNAFVRFQGDLYMNILKNAALDHPTRLAATGLGIAMLGKALSEASGENEEDRKTREERVGAKNIPFTNISLNFKMGDTEFDASRLLGVYEMQDTGGGGFWDGLARIMPLRITEGLKDEGNGVEFDRSGFFSALASDPMIGPLISVATDSDFRGKSVQDPNGYRDGKFILKPGEELPSKTTPDEVIRITSGDRKTSESEWGNRLAYVVRSYNIPFLNDMIDLKPASEGKENFYGKERTLAQQAARGFLGIKTEQYGPEQAKKQRDLNSYFDMVATKDEIFASVDSKTRGAYDQIHPITKKRDGTYELDDNPRYKYDRANLFLSNPELVELEKQFQLLQNEHDGKPIDPMYLLPPEARQNVLLTKTYYPGEGGDNKQKLLYSQEWYPAYKQSLDAYYEAKGSYNKSRGFAESEVDDPYPSAGKDIQAKLDYYYALPKGTGDRSDFLKSNPDIIAQWDKTREWNNRQRKILGLPELEDPNAKYAKNGGSGSTKKAKLNADGTISVSGGSKASNIPSVGSISKSTIKLSNLSESIKPPSIKLKTDKLKNTNFKVRQTQRKFATVKLKK